MAVNKSNDIYLKPAERPDRKSPHGMPKGAVPMMIGGLMVAGGCGITTLSHLIRFVDGELGLGGFLVGGSLALLGILAGLIIFLIGRDRRKRTKRFEAYQKLIGNQQAVSIHAMSDVLGMDYKQVIRDLKEMINRGILAPAWLDLKTYRVMLCEYTESQPVEKKEEYVPRSARILQQIKADNDLIADPEVSRKIDRIEILTRKIFAILDKYPEKEKDLYRFLNYYLPTTLKALEQYARLEAQGLETPTIRQTKQKINGMLDELAEGYENQLDKLFEDDAIDISADIEVMRRMLRQDGLREDELLKVKDETK